MQIQNANSTYSHGLTHTQASRSRNCRDNLVARRHSQPHKTEATRQKLFRMAREFQGQSAGRKTQQGPLACLGRSGRNVEHIVGVKSSAYQQVGANETYWCGWEVLFGMWLQLHLVEGRLNPFSYQQSQTKPTTRTDRVGQSRCPSNHS